MRPTEKAHHWCPICKNWNESAGCEWSNDGNPGCCDTWSEAPCNYQIKRVRQIRDALNKCRDMEIVEQIGKLLHV